MQQQTMHDAMLPFSLYLALPFYVKLREGTEEQIQGEHARRTGSR